MPYIFVEELSEGMEEADVRTAEDYAALQGKLDEAVAAQSELQHNYDVMSGARDNLAAELDEAKTKFANAFLSTPENLQNNQAKEPKDEYVPSTFGNLFSERS